MLKQIRLKNFVKFKDEQTLEFNDKNGKTISILGPSGSGKSCFLEAIRRCCGSTINESISTIPDKHAPSIVVCHFERESDKDKKDTAFASIYMSYYGPDMQNPESKMPGDRCESSLKTEVRRHTYKLLVLNKGKIFILGRKDSKDNDCEQGGPENKWECLTVDIDEDQREVLYNKTAELEEKIKTIKMLESKMKSCQNAFDDIFESLTRIEFNFASRTLGVLQSSLQLQKQEKTNDRDRYQEVSTNAYIISQFLQDDSSKYDKAVEERIFECIIGLGKYTFSFGEKENERESIFVKETKTSQDSRERDEDISRFPLLKAPEGVIGAKHLSILLSKTDIDILCIDEPIQALNHGMVNRLIYFVLPNMIENKQVILASSDESFLSPLTKNVYICDRKETKSTNIVPMDNLETYLPPDFLSALAFYRRVLFVEGETDFQFVENIRQVLLSDSGLLEQFVGYSTTIKDELLELKVVRLNGCKNAPKVLDACRPKELGFQHKLLILLDKDAEKETKNRPKEEERMVFYWTDKDDEMNIPHPQRNDFVYFQKNGKCMAIMRSKKNKAGTIEDIVIRVCIQHDLEYHHTEERTCDVSDCHGLLDYMTEKKVLSTHKDSEQHFTTIWMTEKLFLAKEVKEDKSDTITKIVKRLLTVSLNDKQCEIWEFLRFLKGENLNRRRATVSDTNVG